MDLRVQKTYAALTTAFTALMESQPYEQITVAQLCEAALIRRTTFYKHFADKDEFLTFYILTLRDEFERGLEAQAGNLPVREYVCGMFEKVVAFFNEHKRLMDNALLGASAGVLLDALAEVMMRDLVSVIERDAKARARVGVPPEVVAAFVCGGMLQALRKWWAAGCSEQGAADIVVLLRTLGA